MVFVFGVFSFLFFQHLRFSFVVFTNKETSSSSKTVLHSHLQPGRAAFYVVYTGPDAAAPME